MPTCRNFRTLGSDFLSGRIANCPVNVSKEIYAASEAFQYLKKLCRVIQVMHLVILKQDVAL